ncbi:unnamed protein product [Hanseniaspora opuntiae]
MVVVQNDDGKFVDVSNGNNNDDNDLKNLLNTVIEQNVLEHQVENKAQLNIDIQKLKTEQRRLKRVKDNLNNWHSEKRELERKAYKSTTKISDKEKYISRIKTLEKEQIQPLTKDINQIRDRIKLLKESIAKEKEFKEETENENKQNPDTDAPLPNESERDFLIRTGKITAFGTNNDFQIEEDFTEHEGLINNKDPVVKDEISDKDEYIPSNKDLYRDESDISEVEHSEGDDDDLVYVKGKNEKKAEFIDDGNEYMYQKRLKNWISNRVEKRKEKGLSAKYDISEEWLNTDPDYKSASLKGGFKIPGEIFSKLFNYQKTCVQWLWELHQQGVGGILGDEMGLGKTIQVIAFLAGLHHSNKISKPILVVCPATVMKQWFTELSTWWPCFRCVIFHSMGAIFDKQMDEIDKEALDKFLMSNEDIGYDDYVNEKISTSKENEVLNKKSTKRNVQKIATVANHLKNTMESIKDRGHVIITTYAGLQANSKLLLAEEYDYVILDEGHKIRNANTSVAITAKKLKCANRLILSGTPIQNNLNELWSLFDFIYPGKLGTLPVFQDQFSTPINEGGYANATNLQVQTGYNCAVELKNMISPFLLRRVKADVAKDLPNKKELVLFCKLTKTQRHQYISFLNSEELSKIRKGRFQALIGIDHLRKICNHPDLVMDAKKRPRDYGNPLRSGKMQVIKQLLLEFRSKGHKTLLFTQSRQMMAILERFLRDDIEFDYLKMDGSTSIKSRQSIVDKFNKSKDIDVFLLTTKVGGLGINLVSATRIIIYDPDWNPSTDLQARERAWRIGQTKEVIIYRLLVGGTIEEKIYHRQIFKQFLTNKILKDPNQKRFFKMDELQDLFSLNDDSSSNFSYEETKAMSEVTDRETKNIKDEVENVEGIEKLEGYYNEEAEKEKNTTEGDRIVQDIFGNVDYERKISKVDSSTSKEAERKAKEAAKLLRTSLNKKTRNLAKQGKVTWTGKYGSVGKSEEGSNVVKKRKLGDQSKK